MIEAIYQRQLMKKLNQMFPGCMILKNDPSFMQGIPDLIILFHDRWAMLELKRRPDSDRRPNQAHYIGVLNDMSFAAFIHPGNEEEVLNDLQSALGFVG